MIKVIELDSSANVWSLSSDRPAQKNSLRKLFFFFFREGPIATLLKVVSYFKKRKEYDVGLKAVRIDDLNGISYDDGLSCYISDVPKSNWYNPFSYDQVFEAEFSTFTPKPETHHLYCIGFGNYVQTYTYALRKKYAGRFLLEYNPNIRKSYDSDFQYKDHSFSKLLKCWEVDSSPIAVVASYHSDHAIQAYKLFRANRSGFIFVEKPPLVEFEHMDLFRELYDQRAKVQIGFNRRYSPAVIKLASLLSPEKMMINISVNEVRINDTHWYLWGNQGTRITGNGCHWIDLCQYLIKSKPIEIGVNQSVTDKDDCNMCILYENGSLASISLSDKGSELRGVQEQIEVKQNGSTYKVDDMLSLTVDLGLAGRYKHNYFRRDKGHKEMYSNFYRSVKQGTILDQYPLDDLEKVMLVTHTASKMLVNNQKHMSLEV